MLVKNYSNIWHILYLFSVVSGCYDRTESITIKTYANPLFPNLYTDKYMAFQLKTCTLSPVPRIILQHDQLSINEYSLSIQLTVLGNDIHITMVIYKNNYIVKRYFEYPVREDEICAQGYIDHWISFHSGNLEFGIGVDTKVAEFIFDDIIPSFDYFSHVFFENGDYRGLSGK